MPVRILLLLLLLTILSGCKFKTHTDLYVSDLEEVASGKTANTEASILIAIQMPTADECRKQADEVIALLGRYFGETTFHKCATERFEDFLIVRGSVPILRATGAETHISKGKGFLYFIVNGKEGDIEVYPHLVTGRYAGFQALVSHRYNMDIDPEDVSMGVTLRNDGRGKRQVEVCSVYADEQPVPFCGSVVVPRRRFVELRLSTVLTRYLVKNGISRIPLVTIKEKQ